MDSNGYPAFCWPEFQILRTPLMIAASKGYLPIVGLLFNPPCKANHTLCAPDGQTALRLAADNGHREVVNFLPSLRRGGFRRFKHQHATSVYRIRLMTEMARAILWGLFWQLPKALVYDIPKWIAKLLWEVGKYFVTDTIPRAGRYLTNEFPKLVKRAGKSIWGGLTVHFPRAIRGTGKFIWKTISVDLPRVISATGRFIWKTISVYLPRAISATGRFIWKTISVYLPRAISATGKFIWKTITVYLPRAITATGRFIWKTITVHIPNMVIYTAKLIWSGAKSVAIGLKTLVVGSWNLFVKGVLAIASLIHSILEAVVSFFRRITLKDIWNGFVQVLHWLFVEVPTAIAGCLAAVYNGLCRAIVAVFGWLGELALMIWHGLVTVVTYYPVKLFKVLLEYSKVFVRGGKEILIWFNPKR